MKISIKKEVRVHFDHKELEQLIYNKMLLNEKLMSELKSIPEREDVKIDIIITDIDQHFNSSTNESVCAEIIINQKND